MVGSSVEIERKKIVKKKQAHQRRARRGCMRGKGGPENALCTYRGVRQRTWGKWVAEIREPNQGPRRWIGTFDTSIEAALAYDDVARKLYGSTTAKLNLPSESIKPIISTYTTSTDHEKNENENENVLSRKITRPEEKLLLIEPKPLVPAFSSSSNDVNGGGREVEKMELFPDLDIELKGNSIEGGEGNSVIISEVVDDDEVGQFFENLTLTLPEVEEALWLETTVGGGGGGGGGGGFPISVPADSEIYDICKYFV